MTITYKTKKYSEELLRIRNIKDPNEFKFNIIKLQHRILMFYIRTHRPYYERIIQMINLFCMVNKGRHNTEKNIKRMEIAIDMINYNG